MLNEMQTTQITDTLGQRIDYINWNTSNRIFIYPKLSNSFFSLSYTRTFVALFSSATFDAFPIDPRFSY